MAPVDLEYEAGSLLPAVGRQRVRQFARWLADYFERPIRLPAAYAEHLAAFHGGVPGKSCFATPAGRVRVVCRFFNLLRPEDLRPPLLPSWRSEAGYSASPDIRLDYSVYHYFDDEMWDGRLRESDSPLVPIAGLDTAGHNCRVMAEYDLLCLRYDEDEEEGEPAVVLFDFHESVAEAVTEFVAPSFAAFLPMLHRCRNRVTQEAVDKF
jgi:hypothetical protein